MCGSKGTRHMSNCPEAGTKKGARPQRVPRLVGRYAVPLTSGTFDARELADEQLVECVQEATRRAVSLRERAQKLEQLVAEARHVKPVADVQEA
jgi:hypothetical protein